MAGFFSEREKYMGELVSKPKLMLGYKKSESKLNKAAKRGNVSDLEKEMRKHHEYEYALLYRKVLDGQKRRRKQDTKKQSKRKRR